MIRREITRGIVGAVMASALVGGAVGSPQAAQAAWPGSNGLIFFVCTELGGSTQDICRISPDGSGLLNLTSTPSDDESAVDVSPNGSQVSFVRGTGDAARVFVMNSDGSGQHVVTTLPSVGSAWTPDGAHIAYRAKVGASSYELQIIPVGGGSPTVLRAASPSDFPPRYTANGSWLYGALTPVSPGSGVSTSQVFVVSSTGTQQVTSSDPALQSNNFPSWAPSGDKIVYSRQDDLYAVSSGGGAEVQLTNTAAPLKESAAQYSPDGTKLVFQQEDATHDFFHRVLVISNADGTSPVPIPTPTLKSATFPVWAPPVGGTPPPAPVASFTADAPSKVKGTKRVKVTLRCIGDTVCVVTYGAKLKVPGAGKFTIDDKALTLAAHTEQVVSLKLDKAAKRAVKAALKDDKLPKYHVSVVARQPSGTVIRSLGLKVAVTS